MSTAILRATATVAMLAPRRARIRSPNARSGPGVRTADHAASTSRCLASEGALLGDPAVTGGGRSRLADPGVESEVAHQVPRRREPGDVTDGSHHPGRRHGTHPWDGQDPADLRPGMDPFGDRPVDEAELHLNDR